MKEQFITYGKRKIYYQIKLKERKTLKISVLPNLEVKVVAPKNADNGKIVEKIQKKAKWIVKQQNFFKEFLPKTPPRKYISGETHLYLGKQYKLKVLHNHVDEVKLKSGRLVVKTRDKHPLLVEHLLGGWYKSHADEIFGSVLDERMKKFKRYKVSKPKFIIKRLKNKWGTCSKNGRITLNPELIKAPKGCIEYVINHELCHLVEHNHSNAYYELQETTMPDWTRWKYLLEKKLL